jgi:hypothetical protein
VKVYIFLAMTNLIAVCSIMVSFCLVGVTKLEVKIACGALVTTCNTILCHNYEAHNANNETLNLSIPFFQCYTSY